MVTRYVAERWVLVVAREVGYVLATAGRVNVEEGAWVVGGDDVMECLVCADARAVMRLLDGSAGLEIFSEPIVLGGREAATGARKADFHSESPLCWSYA